MSEQPLFTFVLMPFDHTFDDLYRFGIKEPAGSVGVNAERVDEQLFREGILERIYREIYLADIIVAEMTGQNPSVFYEVGYAHGSGKLCILSTASADDIPFDLKHRRQPDASLARSRCHAGIPWITCSRLSPPGEHVAVDDGFAANAVRPLRFGPGHSRRVAIASRGKRAACASLESPPSSTNAGDISASADI